MPDASACPDEAILERLARGELPPQAMDRLARHLDGCRRCSGIVIRFRTQMAVHGQGGETLTHHPAADPHATLASGAAEDEDSVAVADISQDTPAAGAARGDGRFLKPPQAPDEIGRLGPYRVLKEMGSGGMGTVYLAEDPQLKRQVALKVMKQVDKMSRERFLREAQATAAIRNDHIVTIFQVGQEGDVFYLAMELLRGESLAHWMSRCDSPRIAQVLRIGREMATALAAAHEAGLIHRDIKPGNTWLEAPRGRVKILDFGLARPHLEETRLTRLGDVLGTPSYMAPEQAQGDKVDPRCDLFSLGCVLYQLCTGQLPFRGKDTVETLQLVMHYDPPPPKQLNAVVPLPLSDLVMQLLAKKKEDRPPTAQAVVERIRKIEARLTPKPVAISAVATKARAAAAQPAPPATTSSRRLLLGIGAAGLVMLICLVIVFSWPRGADPKDHKDKNGADDKDLVSADKKVGKDKKKEPAKDLNALDRLDPAAIKAALRFKNQPAEVVGILQVAPETDKLPGVSALAFCPKGKLLAAGCTDGAIHLWELSGGEPRLKARTARGGAEVSSLDFHPTKNVLAAGYADGYFRFWDLSRDTPVDAIKGKATAKLVKKPFATWVTFSPDGKMLAIRFGVILRILDVTDAGTFVRHDLPASGRGIPAFSPDSKLVAWGQIGEVKLAEVAEAKLKNRASFKWPASLSVVAASFAPDGKTLACASIADDLVRLLDVTEEEPRQRAVLQGLDLKQDRGGLAFSRNGQWLAGRGSDGRLLVWNVVALKKKFDWALPGEGHSFALAPDNRHIAAGLDEGKVLILRLPPSPTAEER